MNILHPTIQLRSLPVMLRISLMGALIASVYGALHDQITYTISHEYFTKVKFIQFGYADFGLSDRIFAATVGILATWWVGFFAGWFFARIAVPRTSQAVAQKICLGGFAIMVAFVITAAAVGWGLAQVRGDDYANWMPLIWLNEIADYEPFVTVAYIHNANYIGGAIGFTVAIVFVRRHGTSSSRVEIH